MGLFSDPEKHRLNEQIENLSKRLGELMGRTDALQEINTLQERIKRLKSEVSDLHITKDQREEEFARREREIQHKVGLERKRQEVELTQAKKETELEIREGNLERETQAIKEQMKFIEERMKKENDQIMDVMTKILDRLPHVEVDRKIRESSSMETK